MNLETFFEKFNLFADAPNAVARTRELFLQLAVRGSLVDQESRDESAEILLERIEVEKSRRVRDGTLRNLKQTSPVTEDDVDFDLPFNWRWTRMGQVVKLWNGFAFKSGDFQPHGIPVIRIGDLKDGLVDISNAVCVSEDVARIVGSEVSIPENALLIAMSGATTGKVAFNRTGRRLLLNQRVGRLEPFLISTDYIRFFFETIIARNLSISFGSAIPNLSAEQINETVLPLPPLAEQKRIVAKVDELMALCDRLEEQQQERRTRHAALARASLARFTDAATPANLNFIFHKSYDIAPADLRKSILTLAVQGKLVPQDPNDDPVPNLLFQTRLDQDVHEIPAGWAWTSWEAVLAGGKAAFKRGPFGSFLRKSDFVKSGYKVYEQYCPINDDCSFARYYITTEKFKAMKSFAVEAGDFLISCSGVTLGRITQVPDVFDPGVINQALLRVRIDVSILDSRYFKMLFRSPFFQERIFANSTGSAIPNVKGVKELKSMPIPVPPLAEQRRIVAKVDELMALVDALETQLAAARTTADKLMEAVVAELTDQLSTRSPRCPRQSLLRESM